MKSALLSIASAALYIASVSTQSTLTVNTPSNVVECQPLQITWSGGTPPYFLSVHPGATPNGAALINFGTVNGTSFTWTAVNEASGTSLDITVLDSNGLSSQTAPFTVLTGTSTSCLNSTATGTGASAASTPSTGSTTTPSGSSSTATNPSATTPASSKPASSSTSSSTPKSSNAAALPMDLSYGAAGVLGMVVAAVLA